MGLWYRSFLVVIALVVVSNFRSSIFTSGDRQKMISTPDKPTKVFIGENVSLTWRYHQPSRLTLRHVLFGIFKTPGYLITELVEVNKNGVPRVRKDYGLSVSWAGNLTSSLAVFVLYNLQPEDGKKTFGIQVDFGYEHDLLIDILRLQVENKPIADFPRITYVNTPPLVRMGQTASLNCTANGSTPVTVAWYKGTKVLTAGMSEAVLTLKNITYKDWGEFLCVANNSVGEDEKTVVLRVLPESPNILNTNKVVRNTSWTLRWSPVYSIGVRVKLYTVWHRVVQVTKDSAAREKTWLRENVTGHVYHKVLAADTSYLFAVTAWNRWGESLLKKDKMLSISTVFPDSSVSTEHGPSVTPFESNKKSDFTWNEVIIWGTASLFLCIILSLFAIHFVRRKRKRRRKRNMWHQNLKGIASFWSTSKQDVASVATQGTAHENGSVTLAESILSIPESLSTLQQQTALVRNDQGNYNQSRTGEGFLLTVVQSELSATLINTDMRHGRTQTETPKRTEPKPRVKSLRRREPGNLLKCKHSTFTETPSSLQTATESNPLHDREVAQHCPSVNPTDQSNRAIPKAINCHVQLHGYQNEITAETPHQNSLRPPEGMKSPYTRVLSNTNWEVSRDHLSLFERIGGGSFGQVWRGAVFDLAGDKEWSVVAVKMLKENSSRSDLSDLLSELALLKKLKPHPNVIQLLGCFTKDVIRCKGRQEFRPPLVILEFVPHGDLLGFLRKSKGETDDYYNLRGTEVPQKIPTQQLYKFACDIARGMEFIEAHQLIHRDLAARNVLVGEGLRCKITDFGMARDLGRNEIYVRRSNGLMPVKWMAVESLTSQVYTTKSDVWSYGIVLYEIFTLGENPYDGMTGEEVCTYVASGHRLSRTSTMTSELYNLMQQCWHEHPSKRPAFGSIADWIETLT